MLKALWLTCRPHQWVKNLFVAVPLLFAKQLDQPKLVGLTVLAFLLFSALSSSVYIVNDLFDLEKDRRHPKKKFRPIPSGTLPLNAARLSAALLILGSLGASLFFGVDFFACAAGYLLLNLTYSLALKHVPFVDVLSIATGFVLRVLAGTEAIDVPVSPWLIGCTFALACYLGFGKRAHELASSSESNAAAQRPVLARYSQRTLTVILMLLAVSTVVLYAAYTVSPHTRYLFGTNRLVYSVPFAAIGIVRFLQLVHRRTSADSPTDAMLSDKIFMANLVAWAALVAAVIYVFPK